MNPTLIIFLLIFATVNSCIELEISAPSFPDIMAYFQTSEAVVGLTITYNLIGFCLASIIYGPLSECYGRRRMMIIGNGILAIGAIGCVITQSMEFLLIARFVQGMGAAASAVVVSAIIADLYSAKKAAKLSGIMSAVFSALSAIAPVIGGLINSVVGWRSNYGVVAVICIISWILLFFLLPETKHSKDEFHLKSIYKNYKKLLGHFIFVSAAVVPSLLYGCYIAFATVAPFLYMQAFEQSMLSYTIHQTIIVLSFTVTSMVSGTITESLGTKKTIFLSLFLTMIVSTIMLGIDNAYTLTTMMSLYCVGAALLYPIIFAHSLQIFPHIKGTSSSAIMSSRYLLCAAITALTNYLYDGSAFTLGAVILGITTVVMLLSFVLLYKLQWEE